MITANRVLTRWNELDEDTAAAEILPCCGSIRWARELARKRPLANETDLFHHSDVVWLNLTQDDWNEAFCSHPRIGERAGTRATQQSAEWSQQEQDRVSDADEETRARLEQGNKRYEERFGHIFIVCASGKSALEILASLERRLQNDAQVELREAAEQQRQITQLRLRKWLDT